jgi:excinuclease ABC A subunit
MRRTRREPTGWLEVKNAREHNLKGIDAKFPLGCLVCVTGVSGSGKSTLVEDILHQRLAHEINRQPTVWGAHDDVLGMGQIDKIINIDQSPIGRTPRSNPATYTGAFTPLRELFTATREAKARGYGPGRFSFNVKGGRCENCQGDGIIKIEMHFLPDVYVPCEVCSGKRYNRDTLEVHYKGHSISEVLDMTVEEALNVFANIPSISRKLSTIVDVGLGYIRLGQPATTLSGGEAQRVKRALSGLNRVRRLSGRFGAGRRQRRWSRCMCWHAGRSYQASHQLYRQVPQDAPQSAFSLIRNWVLQNRWAKVLWPTCSVLRGIIKLRGALSPYITSDDSTFKNALMGPKA